MVDNFTPPMPGDPQDGQRAGGIQAYLATTTGRIIVGAVALLVVLGAIAAIVFLFVLQPDEGGLQTSVPPAGSVTTTGTPGSDEEVVPVERPAKPLSSTFVFRDIFVPVKPSFMPTTTAGGGGTSGGGTSGGGTTGGGTSGGGTSGGSVTVPEDTLFLQSIDTVDGEPVANLIWNGKTFAASEGEALEGTPWKVLEISGNSVVMLFGDTRVTLSVGQGLTK